VTIVTDPVTIVDPPI